MTRKRFIITLLIAGALLLSWMFLASDPQPRYQGRKLSDWLADCNDPGKGTEATNAVQRLGTNALPFLVDWVSYKASRRGTTIRSILIGLGGLRVVPYIAPGHLRASLALKGFEILGPQAAPAIPALTQHLDFSILYGVNDTIFQAFNRMGTPGLTPLFSVATNTAIQGELRSLAVARMRDPPMRLDTNANWIVPALVAQLNDRAIAAQIVYFLGEARLEPAVAVPALTQVLQDDRAWYRQYAAKSLGSFGNYATSAVPALIEALGSKDKQLRMYSTNALESIAPEVLKSGSH